MGRHEVVNNGSASKDLAENASYTAKDVLLLVARATQAFQEYAPLRSFGDEERERVYRKISPGPLLDVFVVDLRSYRGRTPATCSRSSALTVSCSAGRSCTG